MKLMQIESSPPSNSSPRSHQVEYSAQEIGKRAKVKYFIRVKTARRSLAQRLRRTPFFSSRKRTILTLGLLVVIVFSVVSIPFIIKKLNSSRPTVSQKTTIKPTPDKNFQEKALNIFYSTPGIDNRPAIEYLDKQAKKAQNSGQLLEITLVKVSIYNLDRHYQKSLDLLLKFNTKKLSKEQLAKYYSAVADQYQAIGDAANAALYQRKTEGVD